jgi:Carboxypeptidase regulatory-like domain
MFRGSRRTTLILSVSFALACLFAAPGFAQIDRGAIVGTVRDSTGAVVPNAAVTVTNIATKTSVTSHTDQSGSYQALALIPGAYAVSVAASGFSEAVRTGVEIHVQSRVLVDFTLRVGQVRQEVQVTSTPAQLHTQTADVGYIVGTQSINDLPLNGRRYADLALLSAGVQKDYSPANPAPDRFSVNGNNELQNDFLLDGVWNNSGSENLQEFSVQVVQPPPDALQEFNLQTRTYSAEFGNAAGAVVNASLKSGTNQFHGDLWEFLRNDALDANYFVNNATGVPRGHFSQNVYGGTIGGPIRKDKTFFFFDYQDLTSREATSVESQVPTPAMKNGDFSELSFPLQPSQVAGQAGCVVGNMIQQSCISSVGSKLAALYPDPNIPSQVALEGKPGSFTDTSNYLYSASVPTDTWSLDGRIDNTINQKNRIFGSYSYYHVSRQDPPWTTNPLAGNGNFATQYRIHGQLASVAWEDTLSNDMLNSLHVGFARDFAHSDPIGIALGTSAAPQFGLQGIPAGPNTAGLPPININGLQRLGTSPWRPQWQVSQAWQLLESLDWLKGNHSLKFGYQLLHTSDNFLDIESPQGQITADGIYTAGGNFGLPDFLLGDIDSISFTTPLVVHNYQVGHALYAQDAWRVRPNLTVNYGLRYDIFSPWLNHQNEEANFSPANGGSIVAVAAGASGWYNRSLIHPDYTDFAPRLGFAYHPFQKVVFRGGYGIFYQPFNRIGSEAITALNPPFLINGSLSQAQGTNTPQMFLQTGFPADEFNPSIVNLTQLQIRAQDPNQRTPYVEQVSFGPEFQINNSTLLDLTYVGNWGRHEDRLRNYNQGVVTGYAADGNPIVSFPYANLNSSLVAENGAGNHAFLETATYDGNANYNALQVSLRKTFSSGVTYAVNYTWSHGLANYGDNLTANPDPQNAYNYSNEMSNSNVDVEQRFVSNFLWQLPFGPGKRYLSKSGVTGKLLGDWQFNGIVTIQSGLPFDVSAPDVSDTGSGHAEYANCVSNAFAGATDDPSKYFTGGGGFFINPAAFATPAVGHFGTCPPNVFHGPGLGTADLSLFKEFQFTESKRLEFRAEFFNALNHPNFANPSAYTGFPGGFGVVSSTIAPILGQNSGGPGDPREIQFALKFYF